MRERTVGAVFEHPPREVGEQVFALADRSVDAVRESESGAQRFVQRFAHAVKTLQFDRNARAPREDDRRRRAARVVGGELWAQNIGAVEQRARARQERSVGRFFAGENRILRRAENLRVFDFKIPIRAFDQPHRENAPLGARERRQKIDGLQGAFLIRLRDKAQICARRIGGRRQVIA